MTKNKGIRVPKCHVVKVYRVCGGKVPHKFSLIHSVIGYFNYTVSHARLHRMRLRKRMVMCFELERLGYEVVMTCFKYYTGICME